MGNTCRGAKEAAEKKQREDEAASVAEIRRLQEQDAAEDAADHQARMAALRVESAAAASASAAAAASAAALGANAPDGTHPKRNLYTNYIVRSTAAPGKTWALRFLHFSGHSEDSFTLYDE